MAQFKLLGVNRDAKTIKGLGKGYLTGILYLAPHKLSGFQVCSMASPNCIKVCLNTSGMGGVFRSIQDARIAKTQWYFKNRAGFMAALVTDLDRLERKAARDGLTPCARLNGTSDILWERVPCERGGKAYASVMEAFPSITFYDYTKHAPAKRAVLPDNYSLVFSLDERAESTDRATLALAAGMNVAAVFRKALPSTYLGAPVVVGDESDLRFLDARGVVVGLTAKGKAKSDKSGFVRDIGA